MTDEQFEVRMNHLVKSERKITFEILTMINMAEDRKLDLKRGFSNIHKWLLSYGYSDGAAARRLDAARLLKSLPEVKEKLLEGEVNLTSLSKAQCAIRRHEKAG